ncbi:hypothetical protein GQ53DRAFT_686780 [Thozetella sp. PMI_491]|nr:hypothetical protein GQ53DRAFT_686780 [Thozetella sp. PMI_491]
MGHAWLDSLSEDWVSQPGSDTSLSAPAAPSQHATNSTSPTSSNPKLPISRIPRAKLPNQGQPAAANDGSSRVLSERSFNDINLPGSTRHSPSKLSQEIKAEQRGRYASRSMSASTSNSVVHNTVQHKSLSASPAKTRGQTPEWRRRLVYGDLSYGEQRDLFTSAGTGLEAIFKPPAPMAPGNFPDAEETELEEDQTHGPEATLPSSPPAYARDPSTVEIHVDESQESVMRPPPERQGPKQMKYRRTDEESEEASGDSDFSIAPDSFQESQGLSLPQSEDMPESRKVSGQSDMRNEDFSPIMLTRRQASNGRTSFGPAELPPDELRQRLEKLRRNQLILTTRDNDRPSRLGENTEDYEKLAGFINFRRGGRSADGSFRNHILSSALNDTSELAPEESLQASTPKQFPSVRMEHWEDTTHEYTASPNLPPVPNPSPDKKPNQGERSNGSPLKLFQPYDTFTNQTLMRRLSQFELDVEPRSGVRPGAQAPEPEASASETELEQDLEGSSSARGGLEAGDRRSSASVGQFGGGRLDGYEFNDEFTINHDSSGLEDKENRGPDGDSIQLPRARIFDITHDSSPLEAEDIVVHRRRKSGSISSRHSVHTRPLDSRKHVDEAGFDRALLSTPQPDMADGKRPRNSPAKDPTPKRRRTLHKSDIAWGVEDPSSAIESAQFSHQQMQSALGKKRKDARQGDALERASPEILASRDILRPRTPTPSQRSSVLRERQPLAEIEKPPGRSSQTADALPVGASMEVERKPSIRTEDFINEANKIMAMIRNKAGLASGLASVDESEAENSYQNEDSSFEESTREPFSRPPSREGRGPVARMSTRQEDPEIVLRLKKYEEASDMGDLITSSMRSASMAQNASRNAQPGTSNGVRPSILDAEEVSDPPNLRVTQNPLQQRRSADSLKDGFPSNGSGASSGSIPTGSSRGSDSRRVIAPESVEHLIGQQVGNMILDKDRNLWIRQKRPKPNTSRASFLPSEGSEEDPFAGIPDLTVDMTEELQNLRLLASRKEAAALVAQSQGFTPASPSKSTHTDDFGESALSVDSVQPKAAQGSPSSPGKATQAEDEEVEHEIRIHEDRGTPKKRNLTISFSSPIASIIQDVVGEDADITVADESSIMDQSAADASYGSIKRGRGRRKASLRSMSKTRGTSTTRSGSQGPTRHLSVRGQTLLARPVSRIDERDEENGSDKVNGKIPSANIELSVLGDSSMVTLNQEEPRRTSLSFVVTTPRAPQSCPIPGTDAAPVISRYVGTLSLSPMSDFTAHHDETLPLEASYILGDHHLATGDRSKRVLSMTTRDLVDKLAEVEPFEPYWEDMRELELAEKRLESLHCLDEFCNHIETLDVSNNMIRNLAGIPSSVRHLRVPCNELSSLTAWGHLMNLQYVDVSNNSLTGLSAFRDLVHLRELRVDNNQLTSLDGVKFHDALQSISARGNLIEEINFDGTGMTRLSELDLKGNKITSLINFEQLPSLTALNLDDNQLLTLKITADSSLKYLKVNSNSLTELALHHLPHLRMLHADRNRLSKITGFSRARHVDSLSLREQHGEEPLDVAALLDRVYEIRKLYLSGNLFPEFNPPVPMLNLQLLELASCGLASLPATLNVYLPNLRVANFNYNALSDLRPLRGIPRLKRLSVAGNRLSNVGALVGVAATFPHLASADLRANPVCQGFYPPVQVLVRASEVVESFVLPDQDLERDCAYASRLDLDTRVRRRLYEGFFVGYCARLKKLDGLPLDRAVNEIRDSVWKALAARGLAETETVVVDAEFGGSLATVVDAGYETASASPEPEETSKPELGAEESMRWPAENSFA